MGRGYLADGECSLLAAIEGGGEDSIESKAMREQEDTEGPGLATAIRSNGSRRGSATDQFGLQVRIALGMADEVDLGAYFMTRRKRRKIWC
jgi:hypothetical protein